MISPNHHPSHQILYRSVNAPGSNKCLCQCASLPEADDAHIARLVEFLDSLRREEEELIAELLLLRCELHEALHRHSESGSNRCWRWKCWRLTAD